MMTRVRDQRGFTVAEMLVSAAVIALIMGGLLSLLMSGQQSYLAGANRAEAQQNSRLVLERGVDALSTRSIAEAAQVPVASLYQYFADKESVLLSLVDRDTKARQKAATVRVDVGGLQLIDPDEVGGRPAPGQGHLHYRVDGGPVVATLSTKLSFHELAPGSHVIYVSNPAAVAGGGSPRRPRGRLS